MTARSAGIERVLVTTRSVLFSALPEIPFIELLSPIRRSQDGSGHAQQDPCILWPSFYWHKERVLKNV